MIVDSGEGQRKEIKMAKAKKNRKRVLEVMGRLKDRIRRTVPYFPILPILISRE